MPSSCQNQFPWVRVATWFIVAITSLLTVLAMTAENGACDESDVNFTTSLGTTEADGHYLSDVFRTRGELLYQIDVSAVPQDPNDAKQTLYEIMGIRAGGVQSVTQLDNIVYVLRQTLSTVLRFDAATGQRLDDILLDKITWPTDIAACQDTKHLYVTSVLSFAFIQMSPAGTDVQSCLPEPPSDEFRPHAVSVASAKPLAIASDGGSINVLALFGSDRRQLYEVKLPKYMTLCHAAQNAAGRFVVCYEDKRKPDGDPTCLAEVAASGRVRRRFDGSLGKRSFPSVIHINVDSRGDVLVADGRRVLLLDADLELRRAVVTEDQLTNWDPVCVSYVEHAGRLLVASRTGVRVFDVLKR